MPKFRKKPVVIEAVQWNGKNMDEVNEFIGVAKNPSKSKHAYGGDGKIYIKTLEGVMEASKGDWIIKGISKELYPCKPDIFEKTYEPAE